MLYSVMNAIVCSKSLFSVKKVQTEVVRLLIQLNYKVYIK